MPNKLFNQQNQFENAFAKWMSIPHDDWKFKLKNPIHGTFVNGEYIPPPGMDIVNHYNLNKNPRWPEASYNDLLNLDKNSVLLNLHNQDNDMITNILSKKLWDNKESEFIKDIPNRIKEMQKKYLESDLTWSDADTARDWYAVSATPDELAEWDKNSKKTVIAGLGTLASIYAAPYMFKGLKSLNRFANLKTASGLRSLGMNKTAKALTNYGVLDAGIDLGFTGSLALDTLKGNTSGKDLATNIGLTTAIMARKPLWKGLKWIGSKVKPFTPIVLTPTLLSGSEPIKDDKNEE